MRKCITCGTEIPEGRIKAMPSTNTCVQHSQADRYVGNVVSQGNPEAGDSFEELDVVRTVEDQQRLAQYKAQLGNYK